MNKEILIYVLPGQVGICKNKYWVVSIHSYLMTKRLK